MLEVTSSMASAVHVEAWSAGRGSGVAAGAGAGAAVWAAASAAASRTVNSLRCIWRVSREGTRNMEMEACGYNALLKGRLQACAMHQPPTSHPWLPGFSQNGPQTDNRECRERIRA